MINLHVEQTASGQRRWVHVSRSGRKYSGETPDVVERKWLLATLHKLCSVIDGDDKKQTIGREMCARLYGGIVSFGDLSVEQMRELRQVYTDALIAARKLEAMQRIEPMATEKQLRKIKALGMFSAVGRTYGRQWLWKKLKEWVPRWKNADRVKLEDLTQQEAWYVIQRLERIEKRINDGSGKDQDA